MTCSFYKNSALILLAAFTFAGCATTRARKVDEKAELAGQVSALQTEIQAKDQQIQELQDRLDSRERALDSASNFSKNNKSAGHSTLIRISGVSVLDVQKALIRAGMDPGPADGRMGKKTKAAIKAFQRQHNLSADGIVGEKTWSLMK